MYLLRCIGCRCALRVAQSGRIHVIIYIYIYIHTSYICTHIHIHVSTVDPTLDTHPEVCFLLKAAVALYGQLNADGLGIMYIPMEYKHIRIRLSSYRSTYLSIYIHIQRSICQSRVIPLQAAVALGLGIELACTRIHTFTCMCIYIFIYITHIHLCICFGLQAAVALYGQLNEDGLGIMYIPME